MSAAKGSVMNVSLTVSSQALSAPPSHQLRQKDSSFHPCIDFRLIWSKGPQCFHKLDLCKVYHLVCIREASE